MISFQLLLTYEEVYVYNLPLKVLDKKGFVPSLDKTILMKSVCYLVKAMVLVLQMYIIPGVVVHKVITRAKK